MTSFDRVVGRCLDVIVAALLLLLLVPLLVSIAVLVRATSRGPALFRQERLGLNKKPFTMLKFRTMTDRCSDAEHRAYVRLLLASDSPPADAVTGLYKLATDARVTPVGRFLRRTSLDELPQLWNVLRGQMSLVGPRPALGWEVLLYEEHHHERFAAKPGLTGLWQVSGRSTVSMRDALDLDVAYVRRRNIRLDLKLLAKTMPVVVFRRGAA